MLYIQKTADAPTRAEACSEASEVFCAQSEASEEEEFTAAKHITLNIACSLGHVPPHAAVQTGDAADSSGASSCLVASSAGLRSQCMTYRSSRRRPHSAMRASEAPDAFASATSFASDVSAANQSATATFSRRPAAWRPRSAAAHRQIRTGFSSEGVPAGNDVHEKILAGSRVASLPWPSSMPPPKGVPRSASAGSITERLRDAVENARLSSDVPMQGECASVRFSDTTVF